MGDTAHTSASKYYHTVTWHVAGLSDAQKHCGGLIDGARCLLVTAQSLHHAKARDTKEVVQRHRGNFVTVEAHPAGACEVMAFSGAVCCAGASNGGLLVPGAWGMCECVFLLGACLHFFLTQLAGLKLDALTGSSNVDNGLARDHADVKCIKHRVRAVSHEVGTQGRRFGNSDSLDTMRNHNRLVRVAQKHELRYSTLAPCST